MNRTTFIFSIIVLLVGVLFIGCTPKPLQNSPLSSKYWENYYRVHLTPGSKVIEASTNRTVELIDGRYIVQEYFYDDRILTSRMIYTDAALTNREGAFQLFYDTGRKNREGTFQNGKREGEVLVYEMDEGFLESKAIFKDGKLNGPVFEYNKYGKVVSQSFFVQVIDFANKAEGTSCGDFFCKRFSVCEAKNLVANGWVLKADRAFDRITSIWLADDPTITLVNRKSAAQAKHLASALEVFAAGISNRVNEF